MSFADAIEELRRLDGAFIGVSGATEEGPTRLPADDSRWSQQRLAGWFLASDKRKLSEVRSRLGTVDEDMASVSGKRLVCPRMGRGRSCRDHAVGESAGD